MSLVGDAQPSRLASSYTGRPSTNVPTTRASPIAPGGAIEQVAIEDRQVGQLADLERARPSSRWLTYADPS